MGGERGKHSEGRRRHSWRATSMRPERAPCSQPRDGARADGSGSGIGSKPDATGRLAYAAYDVVGALAAVLCTPALPFVLASRHGRGVCERLGRLPDALRALPAPLWIHAASVGETRAAAPLVGALRRRCPALPLVMSTTTLTGRIVAERELSLDAVTLLPIDAARIVDRAFRRVRPRGLVLVETELWPGLLRAARRVEAPVVVVSGRLSERSLRRYGWARPLFRAAVQSVAAFGMQTPADAERIMALGAPAERVRVTGSLKASRRPPAAPATAPLNGLTGRPLLVAASTQPGEEEFVLGACGDLWGLCPDILLLLAPRRPERFSAVEQVVRRAGVRYQRRSAREANVDGETQVVLLDTVGELTQFLPFARAVFVGGTVAPLGGHNVLEPAVYGKPVAFGPNTENVADAARALIEQGGGALVREPADLAAVWRRLLLDPERAEAMGARARAVADAWADALEQTWNLLAPYVGASP